MSEIRETLTESIENVVNGKMPLDTADTVSRLADKHIKDRNADDREARRIGDEELAKSLNKAQEIIKDL